MEEVAERGLLPYGFAEMGFSQHDSLTWVYNLQSINSNTYSNSAREDQVLARFVSTFMKASELKVVLLCGQRSEHSITRSEFMHTCSSPHQLLLSGHAIDAWFETNKQKIIRVYIRAPEPLVMTLGSDWREMRQLIEAVRFAVCLTGVERIRCYYFEHRSVYSSIFRQAQVEKHGGLKMTSTDLEPPLRQ